MASSSKAVVAAGSTAVAAIDPDQTLKASKALLAHIKKAAAAKQSADEATTKKRNLLEGVDDDDDEAPIWLTLTTKRHIVDKARLQPGKIPLPHSLHALDDGDGDGKALPAAGAAPTICAITADPQRAYKNIVASEAFPASLARRITRVIDFSKLKAKYGQYEAQRKLFAEHDVFVADDRIINRLPKVLGKTFYKSTLKRPIPVVLSAKQPKSHGRRVKRGGDKKKDKRAAGQADDDDDDDAAALAGANAGSAADIAKEIRKALGSALVSLAPTTNTAIRIGYAHWPAEHIAANVDAVVTALVDRWVPQRWRNVRSVYIKGARTAALPIWQTDELWLDQADVMADDDARALAAAPAAGSVKANIGKKRKSLGAADDDDDNNNKTGDGDDAQPPAAKKSRKTRSQQQPATDDAPDAAAELDRKAASAERRAKLKKQKAAAKKAMEA
ncbi:hypothetical protein CDD83_4054 [Cordyceps sp. RAO-2017]|nr:hypothetical protein CDD83_4054 [Cordyceps sp. RAO-2017]